MDNKFGVFSKVREFIKFYLKPFILIELSMLVIQFSATVSVSDIGAKHDNLLPIDNTKETFM